MAANQMAQFYDSSALKAMTQMWPFDNYGVPLKEEKGIIPMAIQQQMAAYQGCLSNFASARSASSLSPVQRRKANPVPDENKDEAYFERRKKNNDSAKRSREQRRVKEQETQLRNDILVHENQALRQQIQELQQQIAQLRAYICQHHPSALPQWNCA